MQWRNGLWAERTRTGVFCVRADCWTCDRDADVTHDEVEVIDSFCSSVVRGVALSTCATDHRRISNQLTASQSLLWPFMLVWPSVRHSNLLEFPQRLHVYCAKTIDSLDYRLAKTVSYGARFYPAMLHRARYCYDSSQVVCLSICLSVCDVEVSWSHRLEIFENNFTVG